MTEAELETKPTTKLPDEEPTPEAEEPEEPEEPTPEAEEPEEPEEEEKEEA